MSKSKKRTSITGITTATSEKEEKRLYNRCYRRKCRMVLRAFDEDELFPILREHSNVWAMDKDGKNWFDSNLFPELMRK
jgi:hypothetical protein